MSKSKYNAKKAKRVIGTQIYLFDSRAEANHFDYLYRLLKTNKISGLTLQPEYEVAPGFELDCSFTKTGATKVSRMIYTPDFKYIKDGKVVVDEVKGVVTAAYRIRLKLFLCEASIKHKVDVFNEIIKGDTKSYYLNRRGV